MVPQHEPAGVGRGIALFVVQPQRHPGLPGRFNSPLESSPLRLALEIILECDIADHSAEALVLQSADEVVLPARLIGPAVNDLENAGLRGRLNKPFGKPGRGVRSLGRLALRSPERESQAATKEASQREETEISSGIYR